MKKGRDTLLKAAVSVSTTAGTVTTGGCVPAPGVYHMAQPEQGQGGD